MKKLVVYFIILHTAMLLITGFGMWLILSHFFPEILIALTSSSLSSSHLGSYYLQFRRTPREAGKVVNVYMLIRTFKMAFSRSFYLLAA